MKATNPRDTEIRPHGFFASLLMNWTDVAMTAENNRPVAARSLLIVILNEVKNPAAYSHAKYHSPSLQAFAYGPFATADSGQSVRLL
jgi:hypothetical protein